MSLPRNGCSRLSSVAPAAPRRSARWSIAASTPTPGVGWPAGQGRPVAVQERILLALVRKAQATRFGRDHGFAAIRSVADFQAAVPLRTYEDLWNDYFRDQYPIFDDLTWPGRIPYLALTSGTTQGATKYIPVSRAMLASNRKAARRWWPTTWPATPTRGCSRAGCSSSAARPT